MHLQLRCQMPTRPRGRWHVLRPYSDDSRLISTGVLNIIGKAQEPLMDISTQPTQPSILTLGWRLQWDQAIGSWPPVHMEVPEQAPLAATGIQSSSSIILLHMTAWLGGGSLSLKAQVRLAWVPGHQMLRVKSLQAPIIAAKKKMPGRG